MHASRASVSDEAAPRAALIISLNWLGDSIMAMPSLQGFRGRNPQTRIVMLTRPALAPLWKMHSAVTETRVCSGEAFDQFRMAGRVRREKFDVAYVWPRSFRAALTPWLARIPRRRGLPGHARDWMLTGVVSPPEFDARRHQAFEYLNLMGENTSEIEPPEMSPPVRLRQQWRTRLRDAGGDNWIALLPGAAFGQAKRWPAGCFAAVGRRLRKQLDAGVVVLGAPAECALCQSVSEQIGGTVLNLAGRTCLADLAAVLSECRLAITNDSGGMHLAAAVNTPLVAVFGISDPEKTGPLGRHVRVMQNSSLRSRDFKRNIKHAAAALAAVTPEQVADAALNLAGQSA